MKIATLNTNGITTRTKVGMFEGLIRRHDFDILFVQEVTSPDVMNMRGYETHFNIGTTMSGTEIVARSEIQLNNITTLPSERAIAA